MSICINNDLIWISVPRCASMSIEKSIMENPNINYQHILDVNPDFKNSKNNHVHVNVDILKIYFGKLETVCITRNWLDRWLSSFEYIWQSIELYNLTPKYNYADIDNNFIYKIFTDSFLQKLQILEESSDNLIELYLLFINENEIEFKEHNIVYTGLRTLCSQKIWTNNEKCTYEFDIKDLNNFEKFISTRYNIDFKIQDINKSKKQSNKIIIDDQLKNFIWNKFEEPYIRKNKLI